MARPKKPVIYQREDSGLVTPVAPDKWGPLGTVEAVTFHHSGGPRARTKQRAKELHYSYQQYHQAKGWGDIGYHLSMDDHGRLYRLRNRLFKGTHVGGANTGNFGIMIHGNYMMDRLTRRQKQSLAWLFVHGHEVLTGFPDLRRVLVRGHREWPGHYSNDCPGDNLMRHVRWLRNKYQ